MGAIGREAPKTQDRRCCNCHCTLNLKECLYENSCQVLATTTRMNVLQAEPSEI